MSKIVQYFAEQGLDFWKVITICALILLGTMAISLLARVLFGRHSTLNSAISSSIGILFIYTFSLVITVFAANYAKFLPPLPFITVSAHSVQLFSFVNSDYVIISAQLLSMIVLAFSMNLADRWIPEGKGLITWLLCRIATVLFAVVLHGVLIYLYRCFLPQGIALYAPAILLGVLLLMLLTGALKILVGLLMATVNPLIAALYTFFFANVVGKMITKAVLTTGILSLLVICMEKIGVMTISIATGALAAYIPFAILLVLMWYVVRKAL